MNQIKRGRPLRARGTSLLEVLVVMVVLLIGILGVIQIFPGGFGVLRTTKAGTQQYRLGEEEWARIASRAEQIPEEIRTTVYSFLGSTLVSIVSDPRVTMTALLPVDGDGMDNQGNVLVAGATAALGYWPYVSGANMTRRIIGEGGRVPAPSQTGGAYGGLMVLQFSPIVYDPGYPLLLQVYGNDLVKRWGEPFFGRSRSYVYYVSDPDESNAALHIPRDRFKTFTYRLEFAAWFNNGGTEYRDVETTISVAPNASGGYYDVDFGALPAVSGFGTLLSVDWDSVRLARSFDQLADPTLFTGDPYEYVLLDGRLGVLLFNPRGYDYKELRGNNRRVPLTARVNYDVLDWRIIRDEFRVPDEANPSVKLKLDGIKVKGDDGPDQLPNRGMDVAVPIGNGVPLGDPGSTQELDVIVVDLQTGSVLLHDPTNPADPNPDPNVHNDYLRVDPARSSYVVDKSAGFVRFLDYDRVAPGLQLRMIYPGTNTQVTVNAEGRLLRALYQARGEFAVQAMKAASRYRQSYGTPQIAEFYVGQTGNTPVGQPTRIYFPTTDGGKNVTVGEIWYTDGVSAKVLRSQNFQIQTAPADPIGPYIDVRSIDPAATAFDYSNGYAVRFVRGASLRVRVLWNPESFNVKSTSEQNWLRFNQWSRGWRQVYVESFLQKGENP